MHAYLNAHACGYIFVFSLYGQDTRQHIRETATNDRDLLVFDTGNTRSHMHTHTLPHAVLQHTPNTYAHNEHYAHAHANCTHAPKQRSSAADGWDAIELGSSISPDVPFGRRVFQTTPKSFFGEIQNIIHAS